MQGNIVAKGLINLMGDYFPSLRKRIVRFLNLLNWKSRLKEVRRAKKVNSNTQKILKRLAERCKRNLSVRVNILVILILVLAMRLFFYAGFWGKEAYAEQIRLTKEIELENIDLLVRIKDNLEQRESEGKPEQVCREDLVEDKNNSGLDESKVYSLTSGHPIEEMIPFILKRDKKTASFLIAIAKKESNWGLHIPTKKGQNCYNYWGYRGRENPTESGYSCFDSPKQAIEIVGNRIDELIGQQINTAQKMLVWKCGSSCAGHGSQDVKKWVSDVNLYYNKLNS